MCGHFFVHKRNTFVCSPSVLRPTSDASDHTCCNLGNLFQICTKGNYFQPFDLNRRNLLFHKVIPMTIVHSLCRFFFGILANRETSTGSLCLPVLHAGTEGTSRILLRRIGASDLCRCTSYLLLTSFSFLRLRSLQVPFAFLFSSLQSFVGDVGGGLVGLGGI